MAHTYTPAAPVTAPVAQMTVPQAAPMPTIQEVQNPPPVPATPIPVRPPIVIPMVVGGQPFPREPLLDQGRRNRSRNNYADANPLLMAEFGLTRRGGRPTYKKPYSEFIDEVEFPRNFKIPEFATFNGEGEQFTLEHISQFTVQCGEAAANPRLKFYRAELEVSMADLSKLHQLPGESVMSFLSRFRRAKFKCNLSLPPEEYVKMAVNGLEFELRKKFEGLINRSQDRKSSSKGTYYRDPNYEVYTNETEGEFEINVTELNIKKAYTCEALTKSKSAIANLQAASGSKWKGSDPSKSYSFEISKAEQIFDLFMVDKQLIFTTGHNMPSA
ncbi:uncharacterized protein LOC132309274 [Cornus florida]|uniref:uncharacterized protein LOC132309274 n=1 Tax=Cornus florida TaxID=4283 RepID=UPI00289BCD1C|nr:uncharacterized protein LOC132309274 [Cornus florida]